ncbi:MAG: N-acetylmuramoyl-L-alanine amidase [Caldilineales bacterium]
MVKKAASRSPAPTGKTKGRAASPGKTKSRATRAKPQRPAGQQAQQRLERRLLLLILLLLALLAAFAWAGGTAGTLGRLMSDMSSNPADRAAVAGRRIGVIAGHKGFDSGAVCEDGRTEVDTVARIATQVQRRLRRAGAQVEILGEYDARLDDYQADALVSIHADSCIERSGFKVARRSDSLNPVASDALVRCLSEHYAAATGLSFDANTITEDMTGYHAFGRTAPTTAAAIIEVGFLGGDWGIIGQQPELAADGISDGLVCFLGAR